MIRLGTRGSALALAQANWVAERLSGEVELVPITTSGDTQVGAGAPRGTGGAELADKSRFVKEIEEALLAGSIDLAVHSAKDVPAELPDGLAILAVPERADPRDALCVRTPTDVDRDLTESALAGLPDGAVVGTASLRRRALLLALRPDLDVRDLRGNVDTRLRRLAEGDFDAIVLAQAGLDRLGRSSEGLPLASGLAPWGGAAAPEADSPVADAAGLVPDAAGFVPAAGQGCLVLEGRSHHPDVAAAAASLIDRDALTCLTAERALVQTLNATCHTPIGAHAVTGGDDLRITAFVGLPDGSRWIRDGLAGKAADPAALGAAVGQRMLAAGAAELLAEAEHAAAAAG